jgi:hypothetical protein
METADTLADDTGHGILPAGNRRTLPAIQLVLQLWWGIRENNAIRTQYEPFFLGRKITQNL